MGRRDFLRGQAQPNDWLDVMQVCRQGHLITAFHTSQPNSRKAFCNECGAATITECEQCKQPIPGVRHIAGVLSFDEISTPARCSNCGAGYPWTTSPEVARYVSALKPYVQLLDDSYAYSLPGLIRSFSSLGPQGKISEFTSRSHTLEAYSYTLWNLLRQNAPTSVRTLSPFVEGSVSLVRLFESLARDVATVLETVEDRTSSACIDYERFRAVLDRAATDLERALGEVGRPLGLERLLHLSSIPIRRPGMKGEVVYGPGQAFKVYQDLSALVSGAKREIFILDAYVNEEVFELFLAVAPPSTPVRILTARPQGRFQAVGKKFAASGTRTVEVRLNPALHDRSVFVDDECYHMGQSLKDAAVAKPTVVVKLRDAAPPWRRECEALWSAGTVLVLT